MSTTTIRLEEDLKARVSVAAERAGKTAHALGQAEVDDAFHRVADERWAHILETGQTVPWNDAKSWLEARSRGDHPCKPEARTLRG